MAGKLVQVATETVTSAVASVTLTGIEFNTPTSAYNYDNITVNIFGVK